MARRIKRSAIPNDVAQGKAENLETSIRVGETRSIADGLNYVEDKRREEQLAAAMQAEGISASPEQHKGFLRRIAEFGLLPAAAAAKGINALSGNRISGGEMSVRDIASATADRPIGYALGLGTVAAEAVLVGKAASALRGGQVAGKLPKRVQGIFSKQGYARVTEKSIEMEAKKAGLSKAAIGQVRRELGRMRVQQVAMNLRNTQGSMLGNYIKGSFGTKRLGGAILLGWLGADTIAQSTSMQASKVENNVIFGQMSKSQGLAQIEELQGYNNMAKGAIIAAGIASPAAIPFLLFGWQSTRLSDSQMDKSTEVIRGL